MTEVSDKTGTKLNLNANVISTNINGDLLKSTIDEIVNILELDNEDDCEMGERIAGDLLENGRNVLIEHEGDIVRRVFVKVMDNDHNRLMDVVRKYFRQQWETQYASSNPWFISFLKEYENGENHDIYERILTRTAHYGNKYMKDCPLLSIVLQLLSKGIDDPCLQETNNVFDNLWTTITNDGKQSITKYSKYLTKKVLDEKSTEASVLFEALRNYYRPNVFSSLEKSGIKSNQNLYDLALNNVVEYGWLSDMKSIKDETTPKKHQMLLKELSCFYTHPDLSRNSDSLSSTKEDGENNEEQSNVDLSNNFSEIFLHILLELAADEPSKDSTTSEEEDIEMIGTQKGTEKTTKPRLVTLRLIATMKTNAKS